MRGLVHVVTAVAMVAGSGQVAMAQKQSEFDVVVRRGMRAYQAKDFDAAIRAFERAYRIRPEPEMIFNVARSHEKALRVDQAIANYERFLVLEGTTAQLRARALKSLTSLRAEKAARLEAETMKSAPPPAPPARTRTDRRRPSDRATTTTARVPKASSPRVLEWSLFGGGMAIAVTGAVFAGLALSNKSDFDDEKALGADADPQRLEDLRDDLDRNALVADVLVPIGLVTAAVGLSLLVFGGDDDDALTLRVGANPSLAGLNLSGTF